MSSLLYADGSQVPPQAANLARLRANFPSDTRSAIFGGGRAYRGTSHQSQELSLMRSPHLSADASAIYERQTLSDRARDLVRNEADASTATRKSVGMVIGSGWKLQSRPDFQALGITRAQSRTLAKSIERIFSAWATDPRFLCDARRETDFGGLLRLMFSERRTVGEFGAVMQVRKNPPKNAMQTCVHVIDTDRISNPNGQINTEFHRDGFDLDEYGAWHQCHLARRHKGDVHIGRHSFQWDIIPRETDYGRPVMVYGKSMDRPEQTRGLSPFAPLIETFAMKSKMRRAELQTALINAMMGAFVRSSFDPEAMATVLGLDQSYATQMQGWQDVRQTYYSHSPAEWNGSRIPVLAPGDSVDLNVAPRQTSAFKDFTAILEQGMAAHLDVFVGQMNGNYNGLNYSTLRGAFNEVWNSVMVQRDDFRCQGVQPIFLCVIDEAEDIGAFDDLGFALPPLWDNPGAWTQSDWIGPSRGNIDPEKEAKADIIAIRGGLKSRTDVLASRGKDIEAHYTQLGEEKTLAEEHGIESETETGDLLPTQSAP